MTAARAKTPRPKRLVCFADPVLRAALHAEAVRLGCTPSLVAQLCVSLVLPRLRTMEVQ